MSGVDLMAIVWFGHEKIHDHRNVVNGNSSSIAGERHSAAINIGNDSNSVQAPKTAGERHTAEQVFKV